MASKLVADYFSPKASQEELFLLINLLLIFILKLTLNALYFQF